MSWRLESLRNNGFTPAQLRRAKRLLELKPSPAALDRIADAATCRKRLRREPERILGNILWRQSTLKRRIAFGVNRPHPPWTEADQRDRFMLSACDPNVKLMLHRRINARLAAIHRARGDV